MPEQSIQRAVVRTLQSSGIAPPAKVLDLSCGDGDILEQLAERGYSVEGTHYKEDDYILRNRSPILKTAPIHHGTDLTQPLPFDDGSFDIVLATEVFEHLPSHASILAEVGRILAPGGLLIFTTPNVHRLSSRFQFMFTGTHSLCGARLGWHVPPDELYSTHFNPVYFPVAHALLHQSGLQTNDLGTTKVQGGSALLLPLLYPFIFLASLIEASHFRKRSPDGGKDLLRWLLHPKLLLSKQLVVIATKPGK